MNIFKRLLPSVTARRNVGRPYVDENGLEIVKVFGENGSKEFRAYIQSYDERLLAHVRVFARNKQGIARPTPKGIAVEIRDLPELAQAVEALLTTTSQSR